MQTVDKTIGELNDVFTIGKEGKTRERLPDGSLLCRDVPFARTGAMVYCESEFAGGTDENGDPITSPDGVVIVHRDGDVLFAQPTIESFETAPITVKHPPVFLNPDNRAEYDQGSIRNIRQGTGVLSDYLLADMVIRGREGLDAVEGKGISEVSPGYDAGYAPIPGKPGHYKQTYITGNHLAIVERGRGGRGVRIGDHEGKQMAFKKKSWGQKLMAAITTNDADGVEEAIREGAEEMPERVEPTLDRKTRDDDINTVGENDNKFHAEMMAAIGDLSAKIDALVAAMTAQTTDEDQTEKDRRDEGEGEAREDQKKEDEEAVAETEDEAACMVEPGKAIPTGDAAFSMVRQNTIATAEIIAPGLKHGTLDSTGSRKSQREAIHGMRVAALESGLRGPNANVVRRYLGAKQPKNMTMDAVFTAFRAAGDAVAEANRKSAYSRPATVPTADAGVVSTADINAKNRAFWSRK